LLGWYKGRLARFDSEMHGSLRRLSRCRCTRFTGTTLSRPCHLYIHLQCSTSDHTYSGPSIKTLHQDPYVHADQDERPTAHCQNATQSCTRKNHVSVLPGLARRLAGGFSALKRPMIAMTRVLGDAASRWEKTRTPILKTTLDPPVTDDEIGLVEARSRKRR